MRRDLTQLSNRPFDVLVIGGGAAGAAAAREACLRGLSTALVERDDFGGGSSAHCFKVVHGGIRYLQHADFKRMRGSCYERAVLLRIAPHLVSPLPFAIPTYGYGKSSKWLLGAGMSIYDTLTRDCNAHVLDDSRRIGGTRFLSRHEVSQLFPAIERSGLTGATVFEDGQMHNPPRLVLAFVQAAAELGATVANYLEAQKLLFDGARVTGVSARCRLTGETFDIRARMVVNAAGPWAEGLLHSRDGTALPPGTYSRDACFLIDRKPAANMALALQGSTRDADALLARNARHLFLAPWRGRTLVGVWHSLVPRDPDGVDLSVTELRHFIEEINLSCPALQIDLAEVRIAGFGLVPFGEASRQQGGLSFGKQSRIVDHRLTHGISGLISSISVRYTVARKDAVEALDLAAQQLQSRAPGDESATRPLPGGDIDSYPDLQVQLAKKRPDWLTAATLEGLARNYGTRATKIRDLATREPAARQCFTGTTLSHAEVLYCLREEMAQRLIDVAVRRTDLGTAGHPGETALTELQTLLQRELQWSPQRTAQERELLDRHFDRYLAHAA